tara:strand:+ start:1024 stop:2820 length:1797 start_codon:yes stop_codon:yes gene_type:complete
VFSQKKCDKAIEKAIKLKQYFDQNEFNVNELKKIENLCNNSEFNIVLADIYFEYNRYSDAINLYLKDWNSMYSFDVIENLLRSCLLTGNYNLAKNIIIENEHINISLNPHFKNIYEKIDFSILQLIDSLQISVKKLPFCSTYDEYFPSFSTDSASLIYTIKKDNEDENFYSTTFVSNKWTEPKEMEYPTNTLYNEGAYSLSEDGTELYFASCNRLDGYGGCDIYFSELINNTWSDPINLGETVNSKYWESQPSISSNKDLLFFSSNREGGVGNRDIWVCKRLGRYEWSSPYNLGVNINTEMDEITPFIFYDTKTLYFASKGHIGMGGFDLYISTLDKDGYFSETKNLGYPINTWSDESSLIVSKNYSHGFFASDRGNTELPNLDLYFFDFPDVFKTNKIIEVGGQIIDKISYNNISNSKISFFDHDGKNIGNTFSNSDGSFLYNFFELDSLIVHIDSKDHIFYTQNLHLNKKTNKNLKFILDRKIKGSKVVLDNILFETNDFSLKSSSFFEIKRLANHLKRNKKTKIMIAGHTDNLGTEQYNQELSFKRARSVYNKLIEFGVSKNQLSYIGFGFSRPIDDNKTEFGRSKNRRTEIIYD